MKAKSLIKKMFVFTMAGVVSLAGAGSAFAADSESIGSRRLAGPQRANFEAMESIYESLLESLVDDETLSQEQADAISDVVTAKGGQVNKSDKASEDREKGSMAREHKSPLSELVSAGTITQEEADAIQEAMKAARDSGETMSDVLHELVSDGTITQDQVDAINDAMPAMNSKTKTSGERSATDEKTNKSGKLLKMNRDGGNVGEHKSPLSELVSDGTITQDQAESVWDAVKAAMEAAREAAEETE